MTLWYFWSRRALNNSDVFQDNKEFAERVNGIVDLKKKKKGQIIQEHDLEILASKQDF